MKKHISSNHAIITKSRTNRAVMPTGARANTTAGRLTINTPAPEATMVEAHNRPGGKGSSGATHSSLGRAKKSRNNPGPRIRAKYAAAEVGPPLLTSSTASTKSSVAADEPCEKVTCMAGSTTKTASDGPVGRLLAKALSASRTTGHVTLLWPFIEAASDKRAPSPVTM